MQTSQISPQDAAQELLRRRQARSTLEAFTGYTTPRWQCGRPHKIICGHLDRIEKGEIDRLMLLLPPQHGKSTITSKRWPAFTLAQNPLHDVISASATHELAEDFGREVRNCIQSQEFKMLFPQLRLAEDSQAKGKWNTSVGGSYYSTGIGGTLFGRGATRVVIDDPFASWEDAQSELQRNKVWDWYTGTLYNRVRPKGAIILIQHRMHEADLAGRLIEQMKAGKDQWEIINLPAMGDYGALWPERYDEQALERIRINTSPLKWSSLYQQNPMPDEGTFFRREWFELFDPKKAPRCHKYMSGDFAVTHEGGDFTEIATHGYANGTLYLALDGWYGQATADVWIERLIDQVTLHEPFAFFGESGPIRRAIEPFLLRRMQERLRYVRLEWLVRGADKPTMARPLQAMASMGRVKIADTAYGNRLLAQLIQFPGAQVDDGVDMAALIGLAIDQAHPAILVPKKEPEAPRGALTIQEMVNRHEQRQGEMRRI